MTFAWPHLLWLLLLPFGLLGWELLRRRQETLVSSHPKILRAEIATHELAIVRGPARTASSRVRPWLLTGLAATIVALARPQWGRIDEPVFDQSREILIAIDLSRSMLTPDVKPSRLDRAKLLVQALLEKLKGERVGLVVFSGTAFLQSPLSSDYEILREFLTPLNPDFLPEGGTNYSALIETSLDAFGRSDAADRFLIVLSDGEATDDNWRSHIDDLKKRGIRVIGLGVGTEAGSMIPDGSGGFVKDERGAVVLSKLESKTLQELAESTHGAYRDASTWIDLASLIDQTVNAGRKGSFVDKNTVRYVERFQWPLAFALWCFLVSFYYEFPVQPRPREIGLRRTPPPRPNDNGRSGAKTAATVAALMVGCGLLAFAPRLDAAVKIAPPPNTVSPPGTPPTETDAAAPGTAANLGKIVGRLSQQDTLAAPDLSELAHETLNWGKRLQEAGQPVPPGPVHDALTAVDQLEAAGNKLADWSQLRKELEALVKPPPKQKPPPQSQKNDQQQKKNEQQKQSPQNQSQSGQGQDKQQSGAAQNQKPTSQPQNDDKSSAPQKSDSGSNANQQQAENKPNQPFAFGDMKQKEPPPPPTSTETQKVGGVSENKPKEPVDPALALPLEKLDQVKNGDSPGKLFQMLEAQRSSATQKKPAKDW